jgi:cytoskeleton protein RodZ
LEHTGIGPTLQDARLQRGKSIEEASRETRIRPEYLQALEGEQFDSLIGDVYARAFLRSYSTYLGLDARSVLTIYNRNFGAGPDSFAAAVTGASPRGPRGRAFEPLAPVAEDPGLPRERHVGWPLVIGGTVVILVILAAVGLLARASSPRTGAPSGSLRALPPTVTVSVRATEPVTLTVVSDGRRPARFALRPDEARSFQAAASITLTIDHGGSAEVVVNGFSLGSPGRVDAPYTARFTPRDYRTASPSATA